MTPTDRALEDVSRYQAIKSYAGMTLDQLNDKYREYVGRLGRRPRPDLMATRALLKQMEGVQWWIEMKQRMMWGELL